MTYLTASLCQNTNLSLHSSKWMTQHFMLKKRTIPNPRSIPFFDLVENKLGFPSNLGSTFLCQASKQASLGLFPPWGPQDDQINNFPLRKLFVRSRWTSIQVRSLVWLSITLTNWPLKPQLIATLLLFLKHFRPAQKRFSYLSKAIACISATVNCQTGWVTLANQVKCKFLFLLLLACWKCQLVVKRFGLSIC